MELIITWGCIIASVTIAIIIAFTIKIRGMKKAKTEFIFDNDSVHPVSKN